MLIASCNKSIEPNSQAPSTDGMVLINAKGKSFLMGSYDPYAHSIPPHTVSFSYDFWMDRTEVTMGDFNRLMGYWPEVNDSVKDEMHAVIRINWYEAIMYCNAKSKENGHDTVYAWDSIITEGPNTPDMHNARWYTERIGYRLPTEAEWEFACRAGTTTSFFWGEDTSFSIMDQYVWYKLNTWAPTFETFYPSHLVAVQAVAHKKPNQFGLYDITGNVWEWCFDILGNYSSDDEIDPIGYDSIITTKPRAQRGGAWFGWKVDELKSHYRWGFSPRGRSNYTGFRTVISAEVPQSWKGRIEY